MTTLRMRLSSFLTWLKGRYGWDDLWCLWRYGRTRFGLMEMYQISVLRCVEDSEMPGDDTLHPWSACSAPLHFNYGHDGVWVRGRTPTEALLRCLDAMQSSRTPRL